jgi:predicted Fe-S protein YdhL (DUF1289 family)
MQLEFFDVPSPCVAVCQSNEKGYCLGCMRTREERKDWHKFDNDNKQKVIKRCIQRKKRQKNKELNKRATIAIEVAALAETQQQPSLLEPPTKIALSTENDMDFGDFEL